MTASKTPTVHARLDSLGDTLDAILTQTRATNGRVTRLEEEVFGDERHRTPGLLAEVRTIKGYVLDTRAVGRVLKFVLPILATSNVAVLVRLALDALR